MYAAIFVIELQEVVIDHILHGSTFKMFSRPGTEDTESDLLRFQEEFLAGRLNPSATVVRSNNEGESRPASAGGKRVSPPAPEVERDVVVTLEGKRCLIAYICHFK